LVDEPRAERVGTVRVERALPLWNDRLGLVGKADLVEFSADGSAFPVEYKHGPRRRKPHDDLQLAAQALCLEEMTGKPVPGGAIFHFSSRRRREVVIGPELCQSVEEATCCVRALLASSTLPAPVNDSRCRRCSLIEFCQPKALAEHERYRALYANLYVP